MTPKDILQLESTDIRQAYLFEENGHWYAYEHSANRIEKFVKGFVDFKHKVQRCLRQNKNRDRSQTSWKNAPLRCVKTHCLYSTVLRHRSRQRYKLHNRYKRITQKLFVLFVLSHFESGVTSKWDFAIPAIKTT